MDEEYLKWYRKDPSKYMPFKCEDCKYSSYRSMRFEIKLRASYCILHKKMLWDLSDNVLLNCNKRKPIWLDSELDKMRSSGPNPWDLFE